MNKTVANYDFSEKTVLILGGSKGIGLGLVSEFTKSGANVYYLSRTENPEKIGIHIKVDLLDTDSLLSVLQKIEGMNVNILVNCSAINFAKKHEEIDIDEWDKVFKVNMSAIFMVCNSALKSMKLNNYGKIVNVSSIAGKHRSIVSGIHYVSSKAALIGYTRQLSYEVSKYNINVNVVCPSQTKTEMYLDTMTVEKEKELLRGIPLSRIASIDEQVAPIMFLCSDSASYIAGAVIDVNGGQI
jgi:NAD(P)-dependent dehydrogenase (short-subunit alcohol dehydrogenase family)